MERNWKYWFELIGGLLKPVFLSVLFLVFMFIVFMIIPVFIWVFWNVIVAPIFNTTEITILQAIVIFFAIWFFNLLIGGNKCRPS